MSIVNRSPKKSAMKVVLQRSVFKIVECLLEKLNREYATLSELDQLDSLLDKYYNHLETYEDLKIDIDRLRNEQQQSEELQEKTLRRSLRWDKKHLEKDASDISDNEEAQENGGDDEEECDEGDDCEEEGDDCEEDEEDCDE